MPPAALRRAAIPQAVLEILERLGQAGHRTWVVGGAVRDLLLQRDRIGDFDLATPATPQQVMALFRRVIPTGIDHGTVTVLASDRSPVEVTTFRGEGTYHDGRRPASVTFHTDLEEDLARRDFTVNALAYDPLAEVLVDPFDGQRDLAGRLIRAVGDPVDRFGEDGLRALRAVRFAAQLGFSLHPATRRAIRGALPVTCKVSAERLGEELGRIAAAPHVARALELLAATGLLELALPPLAGWPAARRRHAGKVAGACAVDPEAPQLRLAALLHPLPAAEVQPLLEALRFPRRVAEEAAALVARHECQHDAPPEDPVSPAAVRRWLAGHGRGRIGHLLALREAEAAVAGGAGASGPEASQARVKALRSRIDAVLASGAPLTAGELSLDGKGLMAAVGCGPGPHVGEGLRYLLDEVLDDPALDAPERLGELARGWWASRAL